MLRPALSLTSIGGMGGGLSTLLFHKVPRIIDPYTPLEMDVERFSKILDFVEAHFNVIPLSDAVRILQKGVLPKRALAVTFDDGYKEWLDVAIPILKSRNLHATFFVTTGQLEGRPMWHERILAAVKVLPRYNVQLPAGFPERAQLNSFQSRLDLAGVLISRLKYVSLQERDAAIELLEAQAESAAEVNKGFDSAAIKDIHAQGFDVGAHTINHPILNKCTDTEAKNEIGGSKEVLENLICAPIRYFAYPNGKPNRDFDARHVDMVRHCGFAAAFTTGFGVAKPGSDLYQIPRFSPWGKTDAAIDRQFWRNSLSKPRLVQSKNGIDIPDVKCLLIASIFPPIHGGSAVVYKDICEHMPQGSIRVLTAKNNYLDNAVVEGWSKHDKSVGYPVERISLLRPVTMAPPKNSFVSIYRMLRNDVPLYFRIVRTIHGIIKRHRINVVCIGELVSGGWIGVFIKRFYKCSVIIYVHGEEVTTATAGRNGALRGYYLGSADKVVCVSNFTGERLIHSMKLPRERIVLIANGVDTDRFYPLDNASMAAFIQRFGLQGRKIIVTVGRLVPRKGVDMTIVAMQKILEKIPNAIYIVIGDGPYRDALEKTIQENKLSASVRLLGAVDDETLLKYLQICDVFVMPNRTMPDGDTEGFGLVFREANACGKPVVGGNSGGAVEAVHHQKSGLLVNGEDPSDISSAVINILSDRNLSRQFSAYGLKLAFENDTRGMAEKFLSVCKEVVANHR